MRSSRQLPPRPARIWALSSLSARPAAPSVSSSQRTSFRRRGLPDRPYCPAVHIPAHQPFLPPDLPTDSLTAAERTRGREAARAHLRCVRAQRHGVPAGQSAAVQSQHRPLPDNRCDARAEAHVIRLGER
eukprot:7381497-Prymnesium_polylepis.2